MNVLGSVTGTTATTARGTVHLEGTSPVQVDGYAGSTAPAAQSARLSIASTPTVHGPRRVMLGLFAGLAVLSAGAAATTTAAAQQAPQVEMVQQSKQTDNWMDVWPAAFQARTMRNADAFMKTVSPNGVDVRGLAGQPGMTHLTKDQLSHDLKQKGPFYQQAFGDSSSRFVISPDDTGLVGSILLN